MESEQDTNTAQAEENLSSNNMPQISSKTDDSSMPKKSMKKRNLGLINQELLKLVSRGSAIICEILRLKDFIPEPYSNPQEEKLYKDIIYDFSIFNQGKLDAFEEKLRTNQELFDKDEDFRENYIELIERFYSLFDSIYQYITDWKIFIGQVKNGKFIQHTIDTILSHKEIRPVFVESVFSAGVMLLLVDKLIPGPMREKLIVSYYRYKGQSTIPNFQEIFKLFAQTGYFPPTSFSNPKDEVKPKKYPIEYFKRCKLETSLVEKIIGTVVGNDIYEQTLAYPTTNEYQTLAYSQQGSLLVVILFFCPDLLEKDRRIMYDIFSKHYHDNIVISFYMGYTIDIYEYWRDFKEAGNVLDSNIKANYLREEKNRKLARISVVDNKIKEYLNEGVMTEEYVLKNIENLLMIMREGNLILRWFILQRDITNKKFREIINEGLSNKDLISLLLNLSQFEDLLKTMFQKLVFNKEEMWENDRNYCIQKLSELISYYSGNSAFNTMKLEGYSKYFEDVSTRINKLNNKNPNRVGIHIGKIKDDLYEIGKIHYINESANARENIKLINGRLDHMLLIVNVKKNYLISISKISDFSFAWISIHDYSQEMQRILQSNSKNVLLLRAAFLKIASILNFPLVHLYEIDSEDIDSVTKYYSGELVSFVREILQIIPISVFTLLDDVSKIFSSGFQEIPIKLQKKDVKLYAQNEKRFKLAKDAHLISVFTKGIFMMEKTLVGVIEVDPKIILEKGIRTELLKLLASTFHNYIDFKANDNKIALDKKLNELIVRISSIRKSFLYIQDYININGNKMWCEEMNKLINYYVEIEANKFLARKIKQKNDFYDNTKDLAPPRYPPLKTSPESPTFLGRLTRFILNLTSPKNSIFCPANFTWYDKNNNEIFGIKYLNKIKLAIGIEGFQGFIKLLGYLNYQNLISLNTIYNKTVTDASYIKCLKNISNLYGSPFIDHYMDKYDGRQLTDTIQTFSRYDNQILIAKIYEIGQIFFLRKLQNYIVNESAEVEATMLSNEIKSLNEINLLILKNHININFIKDPSLNPEEDNMNNNSTNINNDKNKINDLDNYYSNLISFFNDFGCLDSTHIFYINLSKMQYLPLILACISFNELEKMFYYDKKSGTAKKLNNFNFDLFYFTNGIFNILYQMGKSNIIIFLALLTDLLKIKLLNQFNIKDIRTMMNNYFEIPKHISYLQLFLKGLATNAEIDLDYFELGFNSYLMLRNIYN
jgi:WASH complex subunit strumpellin